MKHSKVMKKMAIRRFNLILILLILLILEIFFVLAVSYKSQNFCIKIGESYLVGDCQIGCCIDSKGFEHNNYPNGRCIELNGKFYEGTCKLMNICRDKI